MPQIAGAATFIHMLQPYFSNRNGTKLRTRIDIVTLLSHGSFLRYGTNTAAPKAQQKAPGY